RAAAARRTIALTVLLSIALTGTVVAIALTLARTLGDLVTGARAVGEAAGDIAILAGLFALRALLQVARGRVGHIRAPDLRAAVRAAIARPRAPVLMWLIGVMTTRRAADGLAAVRPAGRQLLGLVAAIAVRRAFARAAGPAPRVRDVVERGGGMAMGA